MCRVEYELSATGRELLERVLPPSNWNAENVALFKAARKRFDSKASK
jgi:DNA-binding HxlR family transcriptional regulator